MLSAVATARREAVSSSVKELRLRLLDLTRSNPLISFDHESATASRSHIRAINTGLDAIYLSLIESAKPILLRPLPPKPPGLSDEDTAAFQSALERAMQTNTAINESLEASSSDEATASKIDRNEKNLRNRIRKEVAARSMTEHARRHGIDPSFELRETAGPSSEKERKSPFNIQTLHDPDGLDKVLSKLRDEARLRAEETSVSPLYSAFGFLEWYEAETSDRTLTSPILLLKTDLKRSIEKARFQYSVEEAGEDVQVNLTLSERLKRDFHIALPDIQEEELPGAYLARVEGEVCKGRPRWRVRRFMTLALFPFARLSMFNDLDEEHWPGTGGLPDHPVLGDLLGGRESAGDMFAAEHDVDSGAVAEVVPVLVVEADASQHSAVYDAMTGRNLVIEGPPGTGKSQTITNLIASALAVGKRVLFVAAKQVALQVVKDRLDEVGLGHFCFDIHSEKARKKDVVDALEKRLLLRGHRPVHGLDTRRAELVRLKAQLTRYAEILNTPFGAEHRTIHQIIWADRRRRQAETEEARRLDEILLHGTEHMPDVEVTGLKALALRYERAALSILAVAVRPDRHPWHGVLRSSLPATDIELAQRDMSDLAHGIEQVHSCAIPLLTALDLPLEASLADIRDTGRLLLPLSMPTKFPDRWYFDLQSDDRRREAIEWLRLVGLFRKTLSALETLGAISDPLPSASAIDAFWKTHAQTRPGLGDTLTITELRAHADRLRQEAKAAERVSGAAQQCREAFCLRSMLTVETLGTMARLIMILAGAEERVLSSMSPALFAREASEQVAAAGERLTKLQSRHRALEEEHDLAKAPSPDYLLKCAEILRQAGFLGFLSGPVREAQQTYLALCKTEKKRSKVQMADALQRIADHLLVVEKLEDDAGLKRLFGKLWKGVRTDQHVAVACAAFGQFLRSSLVGYDDVTVELRTIVADADEDRFRALAALRDRVLTRSFTELLGCFEPGTVLNSELPSNILERARRVDDYAAAGVAIGLPADAPLSQHEEIMRQMLAAVEAEAATARARFWAEAIGWSLPDVRHGDLSPLENAIKATEAIARLDAPPAIRRRLAALSPAIVMDKLVACAQDLERQSADVISLWGAVRERLEVDETLYFGAPFLSTALPHLVERCRHSTAQRDTLGSWVAFLLERQEAASRGLGDLLDLWEEGTVRGSLAEAVERVFQRSLAREAYARYPELNRYTGFGQEQVRHQFRELDREINRLDRQDVAAKLLRTPIPEGNGVGKRADFTELALIRAEISKKTKHISIRSLLGRAGGAIQAMKLCFMMSPLSVAQYIKPGALRFDLLVIDEASQMRPEEAVGVIARCSQMVVVGDPKQLPPTDFFDKGDTSADDDESDETIDAESILDQALARFNPARRLRWHYRSQHGSLIAFSNKEFYDSDLIVFPSPAAAGDGQGVSLEKIDGLYHGRRNVPEAMAVCRAAVEHMQRRPDRSLGIVTLNIVQKDFIEEQMDRLSTTEPAVEAYKCHWREGKERFFVKNLENVQGDERDTIFVSTVFGPSEPGGSVRQNFGPINKPGGHRRLNVLFTRAKHELRLFTSMTPDQIIAGPQTPRGARVLRNYLTFAATGRLEAGDETGREPDSDFEVFVADRLRAAGYDSAFQVGVSGFFLDIAVRDRSRADVFICGVECDGASYHSSKSARDRDILRQKILEGLGWNIYRIWSTDWFRDPNGQTARLVEHLTTLSSLGDGSSIQPRRALAQGAE